MIECVRYTPINKSTCEGIATIFISKWGVEVSGIALHKKDGQRWINFPTRMIEEEGGRKYYPYIRFRESAHKDKFCELVKEAIDKKQTEEN